MTAGDAETPSASAADRLEHPALAAASGLPIAEARCTDRAKLGVLLQGAALLSLCQATGWAVTGGWQSARVDARGRLTGVGVLRGSDPQPVQARLSQLLRALFRAGARVAGRGAARRSARQMEEILASSLVPMSSDDAIGLLFEAAPFLWEPEFSEARQTLVGGIHRNAGRSSWVAGPPDVRRRLLATSTRAAIGAPSATQLAASGRWSEAVRRWQEEPPADETERLRLAESLYALGRFDATLLLVANREDSAALALRAGCRLLLGELTAAREVVERLAVRELTLDERLDLGDLALRVLGLLSERALAADWTVTTLARAKKEPQRSRAHLLAAIAALDAGDLAVANRHLAEARPLASDPRESWRWHEMQAWFALERADGAALVAATRALLASRRRRMRRFEAGRAWNNLGLGYLMTREFARAEHAIEQSVRLLRRCDGPLAVTLPQANLAEVRLRSGKLLEIEPILRATAAHNRKSGNWRALAVDETLWTRFELVRGRPEAALLRAERCLGELERRATEHQRSELAALAARAAGWLERPEVAARWLAVAGATAGSEGESELEPEELPGWYVLAGAHALARERARDGAQASIWATVLRGDPAAAEPLKALAGLDPFRRARLVLDLELALPGSTTQELRAAAALQFRRQGASRYAVLLERGEAGVWTALRDYLERPASDPAAIAARRAAAGHPEAELVWRSGTVEQPIVEGQGAMPEELSAAAGSGTWILRAARLDEMLRAIFSLIRREPFAATPAVAARRADPGSAWVGRSPLLLAAVDRLRQFAASEMPVLILGESGTGKELAAREIRRASSRAGRPWVAINCAALSETLLLSDLFGHARGAFTGADRMHAGVFETATGGTVFLDEIGDLPPVAQGNLLRVLQEGEIRRLGETMARKVDVRLVAATHRDLAAMVREGRFRQDLYYRLKVCTVVMPPLRERGEDVELLTEHILEQERLRRGSARLRLTVDARRRLATHSWPGNVRELAHVLQAAAALAGDGPIGVDALDLGTAGEERPVGDYHRDVDEFRRALLKRALATESGNRAAAARHLGISRQALSYLVRELGLVDDLES